MRAAQSRATARHDIPRRNVTTKKVSACGEPTRRLTDDRVTNLPRQPSIHQALFYPIMTFFIVYQVAAANPLKCVFTTWSYNSRVSIKAPDGINTILWHDMIHNSATFLRSPTTACLPPEDSVCFESRGLLFLKKTALVKQREALLSVCLVFYCCFLVAFCCCFGCGFDLFVFSGLL